MIYEFEGYLVHHGIKGQKWGVQNGPPYPLKPGIAARVKTRLRYGRKDAEDVKKASDKAKTLSEYYSANHGQKKKAIESRNSAQMYRDLAQQSRVKLLKKHYENRAAEEEENAKLHEKRYKAIQKSGGSEASKIAKELGLGVIDNPEIVGNVLSAAIKSYGGSSGSDSEWKIPKSALQIQMDQEFERERNRF